MRNGRYREAIAYLEAAKSSSPENINIKKNLSAAYHRLAVENASNKDLAEAIENERQAVKNDPENNILKEQLSIFYNNYALEYADKGRYDLAQDNLKTALEYFRGSETAKTNLYNITLQYAESALKGKNDFKAMGLAKDAVALFPDNPTAYILAGNICYQQDNFQDALSYWNKAIEINPDNTGLRAKIEKLNRESSVESDFKTSKREHFRIRFERNIDSEYVWTISDILEDARRKLYNEFNLYSDEIIPVIVYTDEQFEKATEMPNWALGFYDGKIRLREQDISGGDKMLVKILYHEYTHAVSYLVYGNNIPAWLHEGFAQANEPEHESFSVERNYLQSRIKEYGRFSLKNLDGMFSRKDDAESIKTPYLESKLFVGYLIENYGISKIKSLFEKLKEGKSEDAVLTEVYSRTPERLDEEFNEHLDKLLAEYIFSW